MGLTLAQLRKLPELIDEFRDAAQKRANGSADAASEIKSLRDATQWKGTARDAADDALNRRVSAFDASHEKDMAMVAAATAAHERAQKTVTDLNALVNYAEQQPACHIDEATNTISPPNTSFLTDQAKAAAEMKFGDLQKQMQKVLSEGQEADFEFANAIRTGTGGQVAPTSKDGTEDGNALSSGKLTPEELDRLKAATQLTPEQIKAWEAGKLELPQSQMDYLNSLARSLDGKNIQQVRAMMDQLDKTNPGASANLMNGLQMLSDPKVQAAGGGIKGGLDRLPTGIKNVAAGLPSSPGDIHAQDRRDLAAIMMKGSTDFLHGSDLDRSVLKQTEQILKGAPDGTYKQGWELSANPALKDMLSAAGRDHWAVHDLVAGADGKSPNNEYISNLLRHHWDDGGAAAGTLLHGLAPVANDTTQLGAASRAGETVHAFDQYIGSHGKEFTSMTALEPKDHWHGDGPVYRTNEMFGKADPELVRALSEANTPFLDDMMGHNLDHSRGFTPLDDRTDANMPHTRDLLGILESDPEAAKTLHAAIDQDRLGYHKQFTDSIASHNTPDVDALNAASRLQGLDDVASSMSHAQQGALDHARALEIYNDKSAAYDALKTAGSSIPGVNSVINDLGNIPGGDAMLKDMLVGKQPEEQVVPHIPVNSGGATQYQIAQQLFQQGYGDRNLFPNGFPTYQDYVNDQGVLRSTVQRYLGSEIASDLNGAENTYQSTLPHQPPKFGS